MYYRSNYAALFLHPMEKVSLNRVAKRLYERLKTPLWWRLWCSWLVSWVLKFVTSVPLSCLMFLKSFGSVVVLIPLLFPKLSSSGATDCFHGSKILYICNDIYIYFLIFLKIRNFDATTINNAFVNPCLSGAINCFDNSQK